MCQSVFLAGRKSSWKCREPALSLPGDPEHHVMPHRHRILVLGGGTAGITVAARVRRAAAQIDIGFVEPSESHF